MGHHPPQFFLPGSPQFLETIMMDSARGSLRCSAHRTALQLQHLMEETHPWVVKQGATSRALVCKHQEHKEGRVCNQGH